MSSSFKGWSVGAHIEAWEMEFGLEIQSSHPHVRMARMSCRQGRQRQNRSVQRFGTSAYWSLDQGPQCLILDYWGVAVSGQWSEKDEKYLAHTYSVLSTAQHHLEIAPWKAMWHHYRYTGRVYDHWAGNQKQEYPISGAGWWIEWWIWLYRSGTAHYPDHSKEAGYPHNGKPSRNSQAVQAIESGNRWSFVKPYRCLLGESIIGWKETRSVPGWIACCWQSGQKPVIFCITKQPLTQVQRFWPTRDMLQSPHGDILRIKVQSIQRLKGSCRYSCQMWQQRHSCWGFVLVILRRTIWN